MLQCATEGLRARLERLYPNQVEQCLNRLVMTIGRYGVGYFPCSPKAFWSEKDAVCITYADSIASDHEPPLQTLHHFVKRYFTNAFSTIHLLPFFPYSSDDGFSVIHYRKVAKGLGTWRDIHFLGKDFDLMFDCVLNHISSKSPWFRDYRNCILPYRNYFIEETSDADFSSVVRPRTSPLLTEVSTKSGTKHVWTTFSADQMDLNWRNPDVFFEMLDVILGYISNGARMLRLDAVAFLWKKIGTPCIHLDETHEIIRLIRDILRIASPSTILLTETNVPHEENLRYFGNGDEAHMIYQFTLPPLLLYGLLKGTAKPLSAWASSLPELPEGCTFFNFTASHDGIGVRPLEGILQSGEIEFLAQSIKQKGGRLSYRTQSDASRSLYEINATYFSALRASAEESFELGEARFLCSQFVAMALKGIPGIYIHSLTATENDYQGVEQSGISRRINRRKWDESTLENRLQNASSSHHRIFFKLLDILRRRAQCAAFHPDASQEILDIDPRLFVLRRRDLANAIAVLCLNNFSKDQVQIDISALILGKDLHELIEDQAWKMPAKPICISPYQTLWLASKIS